MRDDSHTDESGEVLTHDDLMRGAAPRDWRAITALTLWLGDVPHERAEKTARPTPLQEALPPPERASQVSSPKGTDETNPSVREWMRMGRRLGGAIAATPSHASASP